MNKDSIGQEIKIGDKIAYVERNYRGLKTGYIVGFSKAGIPILMNEYHVRTSNVKIFDQE